MQKFIKAAVAVAVAIAAVRTAYFAVKRLG